MSQAPISAQDLITYFGIGFVGLVLVFSSVFDKIRELRRSVEKMAPVAAKVARLEELAVFDGQTGLLKGDYLRTIELPEALRVAFEGERMELKEGECFRIPSARAKPSTLLRFDLDGLKRINDSQGHDAGDQWIATVAETLLGCLRRGTDLGARLYTKGDEFGALLRGAPQDWAEGLAVSIETKLEDKKITAAWSVLSTEAFPEGVCSDAFWKIAGDLQREAKKYGRGVVLTLDAHGKTRPVWPLDLVESWAPAAVEASADV